MPVTFDNLAPTNRGAPTPRGPAPQQGRGVPYAFGSGVARSPFTIPGQFGDLSELYNRGLDWGISHIPGGQQFLKERDAGNAIIQKQAAGGNPFMQFANLQPWDTQDYVNAYSNAVRGLAPKTSSMLNYQPVGGGERTAQELGLGLGPSVTGKGKLVSKMLAGAITAGAGSAAREGALALPGGVGRPFAQGADLFASALAGHASARGLPVTDIPAAERNVGAATAGLTPAEHAAMTAAALKAEAPVPPKPTGRWNPVVQPEPPAPPPAPPPTSPMRQQAQLTTPPRPVPNVAPEPPVQPTAPRTALPPLEQAPPTSDPLSYPRVAPPEPQPDLPEVATPRVRAARNWRPFGSEGAQPAPNLDEMEARTRAGWFPQDEQSGGTAGLGGGMQFALPPTRGPQPSSSDLRFTNVPEPPPDPTHTSFNYVEQPPVNLAMPDITPPAPSAPAPTHTPVEYIPGPTTPGRPSVPLDMYQAGLAAGIAPDRLEALQALRDQITANRVGWARYSGLRSNRYATAMGTEGEGAPLGPLPSAGGGHMDAADVLALDMLGEGVRTVPVVGPAAAAGVGAAGVGLKIGKGWQGRQQAQQAAAGADIINSSPDTWGATLPGLDASYADYQAARADAQRRALAQAIMGSQGASWLTGPSQPQSTP